MFEWAFKGFLYAVQLVIVVIVEGYKVKRFPVIETLFSS